MGIPALVRAVEIAGGQSALGRLIGRKQQTIWFWLNDAERIPAEAARDIERATDGLVTRHDLRPDVFDPPNGNPGGKFRRRNKK